MLQAALQSQDRQLYTTANQKKKHRSPKLNTPACFAKRYINQKSWITKTLISKLYLTKTKPAPVISTICEKHDRMRTCGRRDERDYFQTCRKEKLSRIPCLSHYPPTSPRADKIEFERAQASLACPLMPSLGARSRSFGLSRLPHRLFSFCETLKKTKLLFTVRTHLHCTPFCAFHTHKLVEK